MKNKLQSIKKVIEGEIGHRIDTPNRKREITYARAVFCAVARGIDDKGRAVSLDSIGKVINRDHATVRHNINVIFPFAIQDNSFKLLYETLRDVYNSPNEVSSDSSKLKNAYDKMVELHKENQALRYKLALVDKNNSAFDKITEGLSKEEMEEIYERLGLMVRSIKTRVYI